MKKHDEGYVLAFVMVVVAVLAAISLAVSSMAVRNIETQQAAIDRMQDRHKAEGQLEVVVAELSKKNNLISTENIISLDNAKKEIENSIKLSLLTDEEGNKVVELTEIENIKLENGNTQIDENPRDFSCKFSLTSKVNRKTTIKENDTEKIKTTTTSIVCQMELKGKISEKKNAENKHEYTITDPEISCVSYEISTEEVIT